MNHPSIRNGRFTARACAILSTAIGTFLFAACTEDDSVKLTFHNERPEPINFFLVSGGNEELHGTILPRASDTFTTYTGHIWRIKSGDRTVEEYTANTDAVQSFIIRGTAESPVPPVTDTTGQDPGLFTGIYRNTSYTPGDDGWNSGTIEPDPSGAPDKFVWRYDGYQPEYSDKITLHRDRGIIIIEGREYPVKMRGERIISFEYNSNVFFRDGAEELPEQHQGLDTTGQDPSSLTGNYRTKHYTPGGIQAEWHSGTIEPDPSGAPATFLWRFDAQDPGDAVKVTLHRDRGLLIMKGRELPLMIQDDQIVGFDYGDEWGMLYRDGFKIPPPEDAEPDTTGQEPREDGSVSVTFHNERLEPVDVFFVFEGNEEHYETIQPGKSWSLDSYAGHVWQAKSGNRTVGEFTVNTNAVQSFIIGSAPVPRALPVSDTTGQEPR